MFREVKFAGIVPVPVAAITAGSACCNNHSIVSPSDLCPSSRVSWKTLAAQVAGMRIRRPRPSTFVCRSFVDALLGGDGFGLAAVWRSVGGATVSLASPPLDLFSRSCNGKFNRRNSV
ncbi:hypothetical protein Ccrd_016112 [Cynara cardunculus var. scolymus]|uniref:Uncharacterized protein n=1 Tax=Cynara cardunculus var. scolymus TaxID=59895 RepID=A0A103YAI8_CYNCS|nr:hypothetical protein Ccrd_016112 [Cynara cardunculus var. scolymus]